MEHEATSFTELNLSQQLLDALADMQFTQPSPVQAQTIPWLLQKRDVIAKAQTGTGKTAAFALPMLQDLDIYSPITQGLVLAPTRELAIQVATHYENFSKHLRRRDGTGITISVLCGGQDYRRQLTQLRNGAQVVVGTPGRILDHIDRGSLQLGQLKTLVLDEADEMLRMGFIEDVQQVISRLPAQRQIALFSATMPYQIRQIANSYLNDPVSIEIRTETATVKTIEQRFLFAAQGQKTDALLRILAVEDYQGVIIFVRTKSSTEEVTERLHAQGYRAMALHGDITQALRERVISQFRQGAIDILVATDVAARGLDVDRVTHVINYDVPQDCETYVHRIGRTGRAGRSGATILFVTPRESRLLNMIERHTRQPIDKIVVPSDYEIQQARQKRFMNDITARLNHEHFSGYRRIIEQYLRENEVDPADVAAAIALLLNKDRPWQVDLPKVRSAERPAKEGRFSERDSRSRELNFASRDSSERRFGKGERDRKPNGGRDKGGRDYQQNYQQELFRIDIGRIHGVKPGNIVGAIANEAGLKSCYITGLKINDDHSTVKLPSGMAKEVFRDLNKAWVCGRQLKLTSLGVC